MQIYTNMPTYYVWMYEQIFHFALHFDSRFTVPHSFQSFCFAILLQFAVISYIFLFALSLYIMYKGAALK